MPRSSVRSMRHLWAYVVCSLATSCIERPVRAVVQAPTATTASATIDAATDAVGEDETTGEATAEVSVADAAQPTAAPPEERPPVWTARANVEALARDCDYDRAAEGDESQEEDPLRCSFAVYEQSCSPGSCNDDVNAPCRRRCARTCTSCDAQCRGRCAQCHARCADAACRERCATTCATCLHGCTEARDACYSGACGRLYAACETRIRRQFVARCARPCTRCTERCANDDGEGQCVFRCAQRSGCTRELAGICAFAGPQFGAPGTDDE